MAVRGAPAIGCVAAYGMVLAAQRGENLSAAARRLKASRPTAVNLAWAVDRLLKSGAHDVAGLLREAILIEEEDLNNNLAMGRYGASLLRKNSVVITHCNTGALATAGHGTALGIIREAYRQGKIKKVFVDETRPYLQGARLTAWELAQEKIPHELITDSMAAHFMKTEKIDAVFVGCDRVAKNGDTANKIGTYGLAVHAKHHKVPFYVAMPLSTLDLRISAGRQIPIEERSSEEVTRVGNVQMAPKATKARHPAFDVTPSPLIAAFVTEKGIFKPPFNHGLFKDR
jgi:methylthioribose-1-phosphate isomerase